MKDNRVEELLFSATEKSVPDVFDSIMKRTDSILAARDENSDCDIAGAASCESVQNGADGEKGGKVIPVPEKKHSAFVKNKKMFMGLIAAAACAVFVLGISFGINGYRQTVSNVDAVVTLDINPSIELDLNSREQVIALRSLNDDAREVIENIEPAKRKISELIPDIVSSLIENGYLGENENSIMVTVQNSTQLKSDDLKEKIVSEIETALSVRSVNGSVMAQVLEDSDGQLNTLAQEYGISPGRAKLIEDIIETDPSQSFAELAGRNVNDLNLIATASNAGKGKIETVGQVSSASYIGNDAAIYAALNCAVCNASEVTGMQIRMGIKGSDMVYTVDFVSGEYQHTVYVNATDGSICEHKLLKNQQTKEETSSAQIQPSESSQSAAESVKPSSADAVPETKKSYIGADNALNKALARAGVSMNSVRKKDVEFEQYSGSAVYEVEFENDTYEYEYTVDAYSAEILKEKATPIEDGEQGHNGRGWEKTEDTTKDEKNVHFSSDDALKIAMHGAGVGDADIGRIDIEENDGIYEIQFRSGDMKYDYSVDGSKGEIISSKSKLKGEKSSGGYDKGSTRNSVAGENENPEQNSLRGQKE